MRFIIAVFGATVGGILGMGAGVAFVGASAGSGTGAAGGGDGGAMLADLAVCFGVTAGGIGVLCGGVTSLRIAPALLARCHALEPPNNMRHICPYCGVDRRLARGLFCEACQRLPKDVS
jgi:hypothetical protein